MGRPETRSFLLIDVQKMFPQIYRQANEYTAPFVDHTGTLRDARIGEPIIAVKSGKDEEEEGEDLQ